MCLQEGALDHAKAMDRNEMDLRKSGQNHSTILVALLLLLGGVLGFQDKTVVAVTIFSTTIIALAVIYVLRKLPERMRVSTSDSDGTSEDAEPAAARDNAR